MDSSSRRSTSAWCRSNGSRERDATLCRAVLCRVRGRKRGRERESGGERRWRREGESSPCCHSSNQRYFSPLKRVVDPAHLQKSFSTKASAGYSAPTMLERKNRPRSQQAPHHCSRSVCHHVTHQFRFGRHRRAPQPQLL